MSIQDEYSVLKFAKDLLKADEIAHKMNGTDTFERECQRKALELLVEMRSSEIEGFYQKLSKQANNEE